MRTDLSLFAIHSYLAAEAYAQSRMAEPAARLDQTPSPSPDPVPFPEPGPEHVLVDFEIRTVMTVGVPAGYRGPMGFDFTSMRFPDFPAEFVPELYRLAESTGCRHSLFRYGRHAGPPVYEIRRGSATSTDFLTLGGEIFCAAEEEFFGTDFVAHIHPPGQSPFPTLRDVELLLDRSLHAPGWIFRHIVFGYQDHWPVATVLAARRPEGQGR